MEGGERESRERLSGYLNDELSKRTRTRIFGLGLWVYAIVVVLFIKICGRRRRKTPPVNSELLQGIAVSSWSTTCSNQMSSDLSKKRREIFQMKSFCTGSFPFEWPSLEEVYIADCPQMKTFVAAATIATSTTRSTLNLKSIKQQINLFNLRVVFIYNCHELKYIFHPSVTQSLQQLEEITMENCSSLEEIVAKESQQQEDDDEAMDKKIIFKCLKKITLKGLPILKAFCTGNFPFEWPSLEEVYIANCPQMKTFVAAATIATSTTRSTLNLKSIKQQINLCNLRVVFIIKCDQLKYIFHPSVAQSLQRLGRIYVSACSSLEEIVAKENQQQEDDDEAVDKKIVFQCLKEITLISLPSLKAFCTGSFPFEWPSLEEVYIDCPKMKTFVAATSTTRSTPNLKSIELNGVEIFQPGVDFDTAMENHFKEKFLSPLSTSQNICDFKNKE